MQNTDTICAVATAPGMGAIAVIRMSGENAIEICDKIYSAPNKNKKIAAQKANTIHFGTLTDGDIVVDEVLISVFKAPNSYTGENSVEISCHGSQYIQQKIIQILIRNGALMAQPGEFTLRAFMNGKLDLSQAEAVADLIASGSEAARKVALNQMRGGFSNEIHNLRKQLIEFVSLMELELDFGEEDVEFADRIKLLALIDHIISMIHKLTSSFELGNVIKNGIPVVIAGEPNVGKSTLLNILLKDDKAIVSEIAGTTRDVIEDVINIEGIQFRFIDTAGLRQTDDLIESMGIERTLLKIQQAAIVLLLTDAQDPNFDTIIKDTKNLIQNNSNKKLIIVVNKIDRMTKSIDELKNEMTTKYPNDKFILISAKYNENINTLIDKLLESVNYNSIQESDVIITNSRHFEALLHSAEALDRARQGLESQISGDFVAQDIREALHYLGEITGEITTNEILSNIFEKFCIGK